MLEVVQHQQHLPVAQPGGQRGQRQLVAALAQAQRLRQGRQHQPRILDRRERHEADTVGKARLELLGNMQAQPGLADAGRADQRQQTQVIVEQARADARHIRIAAEQPGQRRERAGRRMRRWGMPRR